MPWTIARLPATLGDVELRVVGVRVGRVGVRDTFDGKIGQSADDLLAIEIEIRNHSGARKVEYRTWGKAVSYADATATLSDGFGNTYAARSPGSSLATVVGAIASASVYPGDSIRDVLIFDPPVGAAEYLNLDLPGVSVGQEGSVRFMIPTRMIER